MSVLINMFGTCYSIPLITFFIERLAVLWQGRTTSRWLNNWLLCDN